MPNFNDIRNAASQNTSRDFSRNTKRRRPRRKDSILQIHLTAKITAPGPETTNSISNGSAPEPQPHKSPNTMPNNKQNRQKRSRLTQNLQASNDQPTNQLRAHDRNRNYTKTQAIKPETAAEYTRKTPQPDSRAGSLNAQPTLAKQQTAFHQTEITNCRLQNAQPASIHRKTSA